MRIPKLFETPDQVSLGVSSLVAILAIQRSVDVETSDSAIDRLMLSGISPTSIYVGKTIGLYLQLIVLEALLFTVMVVLFDMSVVDYPS